MRTVEEIENMFKDMDLDTDEKRGKYLSSFTGECSVVSDRLICYRADTKTQETKERGNAELERNIR